MRFKKYICPSDKANKDSWNPQGCLYEGFLEKDSGCIYCGVNANDTRTIWYSIKMSLPYWLRRPFQSPIRDIRRILKFWWQRRTRGFDDSELWNLDYTFARLMAPRLRAFIDTYGRNSVPSFMDDDIPFEERGRQWIEILEKIHKSCKLIQEDDWDNIDTWKARQKEIEEGMELFKLYHRHIWD